MGGVEDLLKCSNPECQREKTGVCIEGHEPVASCPFLVSDSGNTISNLNAIEDSNEDDDRSNVERPQDVGKQRFYSGQALTPEDLDLFLRKKDVQLISVIGDNDSGKTTLVCSLYQKFLKGEFSCFAFKGSRTLYGFEKKNHYSRVESGGTFPDTERTSTFDGLRFLHLSLIHSNTEKKEINFMVSDRAGENYQDARSNASLASRLFEIKKSKVVILLVDGKKVADPLQRINATQSVRQMFRVLVESEMVGPDSIVQIVITKKDLLLGEDENSNNIFIDKFLHKIKDEYEMKVGHLEFFKVAARAVNDVEIIDDGLLQLLTSWSISRAIPHAKIEYKFEPETQFDRLHLRTFAREQ